jgi:hypothetical protein
MRRSTLEIGAWALGRREHEAALRHSQLGFDFARRACSPWAWELLHLVRVTALHRLGRRAEARDAMREAIDRLAITLEHADPFMLECVEEGAWFVHDLRTLAADLDVPFPPLEELARPRSPLIPEP